MQKIEIPLGARVTITRVDRSKETYILRGGEPVEWETDGGTRHTGVLDIPWIEIRVENVS